MRYVLKLTTLTVIICFTQLTFFKIIKFGKFYKNGINKLEYKSIVKYVFYYYDQNDSYLCMHTQLRYTWQSVANQCSVKCLSDYKHSFRYFLCFYKTDAVGYRVHSPYLYILLQQPSQQQERKILHRTLFPVTDQFYNPQSNFAGQLLNTDDILIFLEMI